MILCHFARSMTLRNVLVFVKKLPISPSKLVAVSRRVASLSRKVRERSRRQYRRLVIIPGARETAASDFPKVSQFVWRADYPCAWNASLSLDMKSSGWRTQVRIRRGVGIKLAAKRRESGINCFRV